MNEDEIAKARWSTILPYGYIGQQSFFTMGELLRRIPAHPEFSRYLDVGCGRGQIDIFLAQRFPNLSIIGIDINDEYLGVARDSARQYGVQSRTMFRKGDFDNESFLPGDRWDGIISIDALQHSRDLASTLFRLVEAWSHKGPLVISLWTFDRSLASRKLAEAWGFESVWPETEVRAIVSSLSLGLLVRRNHATFARRVERSLSSLIRYEDEIRRFLGSMVYEERYALEQTTYAAVLTGTLSQLLVYAPSENRGWTRMKNSSRTC